MSAIIVENLGKRYHIGHQVRHDTLRDALTHNLRRILPGTRRPPTESEDFWALKDVSFKIEPGEVVGIIGRNGAGKSTLLKILSRITEPTTGRITLKGRVASLLEVGTGFHPELSGRENIFLNGAILGMSRVEIRKKFDEIVAFSEVEKFLDTPVKRYSSGMYVRLAFSVAAHLEPEILIVDEVLAVGDAQFQAKCLGKMNSVAKNEGRTVLVVSHNAATLLTLCNKGVLLQNGTMLCQGPAKDVIGRYLSTPTLTSARTVKTNKPHISHLDCRHDVINEQLVADVTLRTGSPDHVAVEIIVSDHLSQPVAYGQLGTLNKDQRFHLFAGDTKISLALPTTAFARGRYWIKAQIVNPQADVFSCVEHGTPIDIVPAQHEGETAFFEQNWGNGSIQLPLIKL
jgi:lipopolysaccharide transport system ATP-binding protein